MSSRVVPKESIMTALVKYLMVAIGILVVGSWLAPASADDSGNASVAAKEKGKGKNKKDLEGLFKKLDTNGDGKLSRDEFAKFGKLVKKPSAKGNAEKRAKRLDKQFTRLDTNKDGFLSLDEFKQLHKGKKAKK